MNILTPEQTQSFKNSMHHAGIPSPVDIETVIADGEIRRAKATGENKKNVTYCVYWNEGKPAGWFNHFVTGIQGNWSEVPLVGEDLARFKKIKQNSKSELIQRTKLKNNERAKIARKIWKNASQDINYIRKHPYLKKKRISEFSVGVRRIEKIENSVFFDSDDPKYENKYLNDCLVVPLFGSDQKIYSIQAILPDGKKFFLSGASTAGKFSTIPQSDKNKKIAIICEGYATGMTINHVLGAFVVVSFSSGQIPSVAKIIRQALPEWEIIIAADNDSHGAGIKYANKCTELNCRAWLPEFESYDQGSDWNDYWVVFGDKKLKSDFRRLKNTDTDFPADKPEPPPEITTQETEKPAQIKAKATTQMMPEMFPDVSIKNQVKGTTENLQCMMDFYGITAKFNKISKRTEVSIPWESFSMENGDEASLAELKSLANRNGMPVGLIQDFVVKIADKNSYNPVLDWVLSKPWDGRSRLADLQNTVIVNNEDVELRNILILKWCVGAIKMLAQEMPDMMRSVLVLQGSQNIGKTAWFRALLPKKYQAKYFREGVSLDPNNKDSVLKAISVWIAELGEIDSTFRRDLSSLKAFISMKEDTIRKPYAKAESNFQRRTIFCGTVNPDRFLKDDTGNSRFWVIKALGVVHNHDIDMQQFWAEMYQIWQNGEKCWLDFEESMELEKSNEQYQEIDPIEELIMGHYDFSILKHSTIDRWISATDILREIGVKQETRANVTKVGIILSKIEGMQKKTIKGRPRYLMPEFEIKPIYENNADGFNNNNPDLF